jgi:hypothetical protein
MEQVWAERIYRLNSWWTATDLTTTNMPTAQCSVVGPIWYKPSDWSGFIQFH